MSAVMCYVKVYINFVFLVKRMRLRTTSSEDISTRQLHMLTILTEIFINNVRRSVNEIVTNNAVNSSSLYRLVNSENVRCFFETLQQLAVV